MLIALIAYKDSVFLLDSLLTLIINREQILNFQYKHKSFKNFNLFHLLINSELKIQNDINDIPIL